MNKISIKPNQPGQENFLKDLTPGWTAYVGGLGSGKTWAAARKFIIIHVQNESDSFIVAPTWSDVLKFQIPELEAACEEFGIKLTQKLASAIEAPHLIISGCPYKIWVFSGDKPERIAGVNCGLVWIDEGCRLKPNPIPQRDPITQIRGRLRAGNDLYGIVSTTPEGRRKTDFVFVDFVDNPKPNHRVYYGRTDLNHHNHEDYIKNLKDQFTKRELEQYLEGKFISLAVGRAHAEFNVEEHVVDLSPTGRFFVGCDFNVDHMSWCFGYETGIDCLHIADEIHVESNARVDATAKIAIERGWFNHYATISVDKSSKSRSIVGDSAAQVLEHTLRKAGKKFYLDYTGSNPPVIDRIMKVNRYFKNADGKIRLTVSPRCKNLIESLENISIKGNGYDKESGLDHQCDSLGYMVFEYSPRVSKATGINF